MLDSSTRQKIAENNKKISELLCENEQLLRSKGYIMVLKKVK